MKQITLKKEELEGITSKDGKKGYIATIQLINTAINNAPSGGFAVTEMMERLAIQKKVRDMEKQIGEEENAYTDITSPWVLELEDAEFKQLGTWVHSVKWAFLSDFIVDFDQQFKS